MSSSTGESRMEDPETVEATGIITNLDNYLPKGIIDGSYFFKKSLLAPESGIKKGSKVEFTAFFSKESGQWEVTSMKLYISQEEMDRENRRKFISLTGKVVSLTREFAFVKYGRDAETDVQQVPVACLPKEYAVKEGDFLRVQLELNDPNDENAGGKVHRVESTNKRNLIGQVLLVNGILCIENNISFNSSVCFNDRLPRAGECVAVVAVESQQGSLTWRAISVAPSNFNAYTSPNQESEAWLSKENAWKDGINELFSDKNGVTVLPEKVVGFSGVKIASSVARSMEVQNNSCNTVCLKEVIIKGDQSVCKFVLDESQHREGDDVLAIIEPNRIRNINIICYPQMLGSTRELIIFDFETFQIGRYLTVTALSPEAAILNELHIQDGPQHEWKKTRSDEAIRQIVRDNQLLTVQGVKPVRPPFFSQTRLEWHPVPKSLWKIIEDQDQAELARKFPGITDELNLQNYLNKFRVGLWTEEIANDILRRQYDMENVTIRQAGESFTFDAPRLKSINPPILLGDPICAIDRNNTTGKKYEAYIYSITGNEVSGKFHESFASKCTGNTFTVQFPQTRTIYKRYHFAVSHGLKYLGKEVLFPVEDIECKPARILFFEIDEPTKEEAETLELPSSSVGEANGKEEVNNLFRKRPSYEQSSPSTSKPRIKLRSFEDSLNRRMTSIPSPFKSDTQGPSGDSMKLNWCNKLLNPEQKDAVRRILRGQTRPLPYIIYGPPGTGKTVTIIEAIIQANKLDKNSRILVVAPSNSAADVIAQYLVASDQFSVGDFVRLIGFRRLAFQVPERIRDFCMDGEFLDAVARNRLIVCTCTTAGQFFQLGLDSGHFTHVFIDEAGYCTEPDALIGACLVSLDKAGQVVLAGDPKQLGPVLMSDVATNCGLSLSLLERLMKLPIYSRNEEKFPLERYNPLVLTKLVKNYRAHPTLLKLPSKLFYDYELEAAAREDSVNLYSSLDFLRHRGTPLLFHGIQGTCSREGNSPSWYNTAEVLQVVDYVRMLKKNNVENEDIGIMTPYNKQAEKLRRALELDLKGDEEIPKIGSVEEFQGGERQVIILSLVRSFRESELEKSVDHLGFFYSPKRFNVAVTRAKSVMIVVGNPHVLVRDPVWLTFMKYCIELGGYTGCNLPLVLEPTITSTGAASSAWKPFYLKTTGVASPMMMAGAAFTFKSRQKKVTYDSYGEQNLDSDSEDEVD